MIWIFIIKNIELFYDGEIEKINFSLLFFFQFYNGWFVLDDFWSIKFIGRALWDNSGWKLGMNEKWNAEAGHEFSQRRFSLKFKKEDIKI